MTDSEYRDLLDYEVEDLDGQRSKLLLTPPNSASTSTHRTSATSTTKMSTKTTVAAECQIFLIIGGVLGSLLVILCLNFNIEAWPMDFVNGARSFSIYNNHYITFFTFL
jgi:hypothetical protein